MASFYHVKTAILSLGRAIRLCCCGGSSSSSESSGSSQSSSESSSSESSSQSSSESSSQSSSESSQSSSGSSSSQKSDNGCCDYETVTEGYQCCSPYPYPYSWHVSCLSPCDTGTLGCLCSLLPDTHCNSGKHGGNIVANTCEVL